MALASPIATSHLTARDEVFPQCATDCQSQVIAEAGTQCSAKDIPCLCADEAFQVAKHLSSQACGIITKPRYTEVDAGTLIPFLFASFFFSVRIASKAMHLGGGWGADDYTISVAYDRVLTTYLVIHYGFGKNIWDVIPQEDLTIAFKVHLVQVLKEIIIALNAAIGITWILVDAFHCVPVHLAWTSWKMEETGTCINFMTSTYVNGFVNIAVDTVMVTMPIYEVVKLKLSRRKKVGVAVMFGMGLLLTAIGIARVIILFQHDPTTNPTYEMAPLNYWSMIECQIAIVCACLPAIRTLLIHYVPEVFGQTTEAASQKRLNASSTGNSKGEEYTSNSTLVESGDGYISKTISYSVNTTIKSENSPTEPSINLVQVDRRRV
ncbi:uncharacterized protein ARB_04403 [Trichophyton benhamiae CBS 112371]|uniref:Integral membrane protein n=1 Tax=Arthroderma benhamiae (strain ATCC MYA-4681 / CBS 112371) TaxID=663331 RepID=D4AJF3_ARTBC|nr:uncharacterized protein ARB_04403 [Trichophyton benhamiae CBS 112371]EFE36876.1 integral membrane protein [Trichophyton benhamiae CBS 112371]